MEIGLDPPSYIIGNTDVTAQQLNALCRRSVREIGKMGWPQLTKEYKFTTQYKAGQACTVTAGSAVITDIPSTTNIYPGWIASATGLPYGTRVASIDSGSQVTVDNAATESSGSSLGSITFIQESYALPSDYLGMVDQTEWDRSRRWQLLGPIDAQEWQVMRSGISPVGPRLRFRLWLGKIFIDPPTAENASIAFEYVSNAYISSLTGNAQSEFILDTDYPIFDEDMVELDLIWRFKRQKGFEYADDYRIAQNAINRDRGRLMSGRVLGISNRAGSVLLGNRNLPDTGYGS
jgi:hypothetical protein